MEIVNIELAAVEQKVDEIELQQLAEIQLALVGGGQGDILWA